MSEPAISSPAPDDPGQFGAAISGMTDAMHDVVTASHGIENVIKIARRDTLWVKWLSAVTAVVATLAAVAVAALISNAVHPWFGATKHLTSKANSSSEQLTDLRHLVDRIDNALSPDTQATQAHQGAVLVECGAIRAFIELFHEANPTVTATFTAGAPTCPPIGISPAGIK